MGMYDTFWGKYIRIIWLGVGLGMTLFEIAVAITYLSKGLRNQSLSRMQRLNGK